MLGAKLQKLLSIMCKTSCNKSMWVTRKPYMPFWYYHINILDTKLQKLRHLYNYLYLIYLLIINESCYIKNINLNKKNIVGTPYCTKLTTCLTFCILRRLCDYLHATKNLCSNLMMMLLSLYCYRFCCYNYQSLWCFPYKIIAKSDINVSFTFFFNLKNLFFDQLFVNESGNFDHF